MGSAGLGIFSLKMKKLNIVLNVIYTLLLLVCVALLVMIVYANAWVRNAPDHDGVPTTPAATEAVVAAETPELNVVNPLSADLFRLTNDARVSNGLNELTYAYELQEAADARAYESSVQFSHTRPNGKPCHSVVDSYDYYVTGENLLRADAPLAVPEVMMSEWMLSEGHRANILLPEFTRLAVGIYEKNGVVYAAQIFMG